MKIQLLSDVHLEYQDFIPPYPSADYLFLAGDIGKYYMKNYLIFLSYVNDNWKRVYYVLGNHEYYVKKSMNRVEEIYKKLIDSYPNITLMLKDEEVLEDFNIYGCTLWSSPTSTTGLNDFSKIWVKHDERKHRITLDEFKNLNDNHANWLKNQIICPERKIFLTHFSMKTLSVENYNNYFYNNIDINDGVNLHGHTHVSCDRYINGMRCISNQLGDKDEKACFDYNCSFEI